MHFLKPGYFVLAMLLMTALLDAAPTSSAQNCAITFNASNQSYAISGNACGGFRISFASGVSNSGVVCNGTTMGSSSSISVGSDDNGVYMRNCTLDNPSVSIASRSSLYLVANDPVFSPAFLDGSSNITVAHYLRVNVFEPFGYNASGFGSRAAGFSYIFPLLNNSFGYNNTELQMSEFFGNFTSEFAALQKRVPFGAYNITQSNIETNYSTTAYGRIKGRKAFALPEYTLSKNGIVRYNPYEVDYSFLAYDQLVMYTLNITQNLNLTPMYIQPLYPQFNFQILPDNNTRSIQIRYLVAVPPQDAGWNFTAYLYRYDPAEFTTNPISGGVGNRSAVFTAFTRPGIAPNETANGTAFYFVNYTAHVELGINSSIMTAQGTIPGLGSFIQDSTTPSFSFGLGFCALPGNNTLNGVPVGVSYMVVNRSGTYNMVPQLMPIAAPALPQIVDNACRVGAVVDGSNITVNCAGGLINDTDAGIIVANSYNVDIRNCRVRGNGIMVNDSSGVSFHNLTLEPSASKGFGVAISDAHSVDFYNLSIGNGYSSPFSVFSSSGTPFSEGVELYGISMCGQANISAVRQYAYIYSSTDSCASGLSNLVSGLNPGYALAALTAGLIAAYAYLLARRSGRGGRSVKARAGRRRRAGRQRVSK